MIQVVQPGRKSLPHLSESSLYICWTCEAMLIADNSDTYTGDGGTYIFCPECGIGLNVKEGWKLVREESSELEEV